MKGKCFVLFFFYFGPRTLTFPCIFLKQGLNLQVNPVYNLDYFSTEQVYYVHLLTSYKMLLLLEPEI